MSDQRRELPDWLVWILAHPIMLIFVFGSIAVGVPAGVAIYLDHRIANLSDTGDNRPRNEPSGAEPADLPREVLVGQTVYVPLYSHIYQGQGERLLLAGTLSIRNTDADHTLTISAVKYYDTEGKLLRNYLTGPLKLKPMGSTDFLVKETDVSGGSGANFIVEWVSDEPVHEPIIEAVMVGRKGGGVTAFVRPGVVTNKIRHKAIRQ